MPFRERLPASIRTKLSTEALQLVFDLAAAGITDGDDANKCSNPHRDAENGENTTEPIPVEGCECLPE
jgi:hypothetical protein